MALSIIPNHGVDSLVKILHDSSRFFGLCTQLCLRLGSQKRPQGCDNVCETPVYAETLCSNTSQCMQDVDVYVCKNDTAA